MITTSIGKQAEAAVTKELKRQGYKIIDQNWKTAICEIDIVAKKDKVLYFVEVKCRSGSAQGGGLEYIGPQKLKRLHFAARVWVQNHNFDGDYRILGASVSTNGLIYSVDEIVEIE